MSPRAYVTVEPSAPVNPARQVYTGVSAWLAALRPDSALLPQDVNREIISETPDMLAALRVNLIDNDQPTVFPTIAQMDNRKVTALMRSYLGAAVIESPMHRQIRFATHDIPTVQLAVRQPIRPDVIAAWQAAQTLI